MAKEKYYSGTISFWKRVGCAIADAVLFLTITLSLFGVAGVPIISSCTDYNKHIDNQHVLYQACSDMEVNSKLLTYDENHKEVSNDLYFRQLLDIYLKEEIYDANGHYNDIYCYFYTDYNMTHLTYSHSKRNYDVKKVNEEIYKINANDNELFALRNNDITLPVVFKSDVKGYLEDYTKGVITEKSDYYYEAYFKFMDKQWHNALIVLSESDQFSAFSIKYTQEGEAILSIFSYASLITFTLIFAIYYFLIPLLTKKGRTLAKLILRFGLFYEDNTPIKPKTLALRALYQYFIYFFLILFVPVLQIGAGVIQLPLFTIGEYTFYLFPLCVIVFCLFLIDAIYLAANVNKRAIHDKIFGLYLKKDSPEFLDEEDNRPLNVIEQEISDRGS